MEPTVPPDVLAYYDQGREDARLAPDAGRPADARLEFWRTREILRRALPAPPARVLDVGGASGAHAAWLGADGHDVELIDPVPLHVRQAAAKGIPARLGDARDLPYEDGAFDAVLLLGPLYHLRERADRVRALTEAHRVARPGGLIAAATINRWAALHDGLVQGFVFDAGAPGGRGQLAATLDIVRAGQQDGHTGAFTEAYFHDPAEIPGEFADAGLAEPVIHGLEGAAWLMEGMVARLDDPAQREVVLAALREVDREPALLGVSGHLLSLSRA